MRTPAPYQRIAIALDFSGNEDKLMTESLRFADKNKTRLVLLHVVESPVARTLGAEGEDMEVMKDRKRLEELTTRMEDFGVSTDWRLGTGNPASELATMINDFNADVVIVGSHGHTGISDLIHGTVISNLRHQIQASMMIVPMGA